MRAFKIKICGITDLTIAKFAEKNNVDLLGFIFYKKSVRYISPSKARAITQKLLPTTQTVGVFVNEGVESIIKTAQHLKLSFVQLSGAQSARDIATIQKAGFKVIRSYHIKNKSDFNKSLNSKADIIHLDNADNNRYGGTGQKFDWKIKPSRKIDNLMLAGGIDIDNVADGVKIFKPLIVDVNSGVETKPGIKSPSKIREFIQHCNNL